MSKQNNQIDSQQLVVNTPLPEKQGFMSKVAHGMGTLIKGSVEVSDRMLNFAQDTKEKSAHGTLGRKKKKQKRLRRQLPEVRDLFKVISHFSEEH